MELRLALLRRAVALWLRNCHMRSRAITLFPIQSILSLKHLLGALSRHQRGVPVKLVVHTGGLDLSAAGIVLFGERGDTLLRLLGRALLLTLLT